MANYVPAAAVNVGGKRYPDLLGVKRAQAAFQVRRKISRLNLEGSFDTERLEGNRGR